MAQTPYNRILFNRIQEKKPDAVVEQDDKFRLYMFDHNERLLCTINELQKFVVEEGKYCLNCSIPIDTGDIEPVNGMLLGFYDIDSNFVLYEIKQKYIGELDHVIDIYAEHSAMCELTDEVCIGKTVTNGTAGYAVSKVLDGSRWTLESDESTGTASSTYYYKAKWTCLSEIASKWNCAFRFMWTFDGLSIVERKIKVLARIGADRGRRFELWKDIENVGVTYDDTNIVTAVYGRGKGEEVGTNSNGDATYGRRITFADVVWSKSNGDPIDKPAGQEYIENVAATQKWGRCGRPRFRIKIFENITDQEELIMQSYLFLMQNSEPMFNAKLTVTDLEKVYGFEHEAVRNGDGVLVIADEAGIQLSATVTNISRDYLQGEQTVIEMGNYAGSSTDIQSELMENVNKALNASELGADVAKKNESLLKGVLDTMKTIIMSSGTNFHTDEYDGSFVWENDTKTRAVRITGSGMLIARSKVGTEWQWETAISGEGIVANTITSGVLQANLVRILGSDMFYWDSNNIHIFNPENKENEIRIGQFDGNSYGIAFTNDGGLTWQSAISFDGVHLAASSTGFTKTYKQKEPPDSPYNGDLWFDTDDNMKQYRYDGEKWDQVSDGNFEDRLSKAELAIEPDRIVQTVVTNKKYTENLNISITEKIGYRIELISTSDILSSEIKQTTISAKVWNGKTDITDEIDESRFSWKRVSSDETDDAIFARNHTGMKSITLTVQDVLYSGTYICEIADDTKTEE